MRYLPAGCIALQILALPLKHAGSNFSRSRMILARVGDVFHVPERNAGVDQFIGIGDEVVPFVIMRHGYGSCPELLHGVISLIGLSLEDTGIRIVRLLYLTDDNRFKFATGVFQV
jgi:hypothetical protein